MSDMQIEIVANPVNTIPTAKGSYQVIELAYKNKSFQDKLEGKQVMSFTNREVFSALKEASFGDVFNVSRVKNDKGFWDWTSVANAGGGAVSSNPSSGVVPASQAGLTVKGNTSPKSTYETSEERAARQILIVRQSSISSAVELAVANKIKNPEEVIIIDKQFEAYVFGHETEPAAVDTPEPPKNFFEDMADDLP